MNIIETVEDSIKILMEDSFWGRNSSFSSLYTDLKNEVEEFIQGCESSDMDNSEEEAADVMMILFCLLYKMKLDDENISIDRIMGGIVNKLQRRFQHLYVNQKLAESEEKETWKSVKKVEDIINYMFCNNESCDKCGKIGGENIYLDNNRYFCSACGNELKISQNTVVLYRSKHRKRFVQIIVHSILEFIKGEKDAPKILKVEEECIFNLLCEDILLPEDIREYFCGYICEKYKMKSSEVKQYCHDALEIYSPPKNWLCEYNEQISLGNYNFLDNLNKWEVKKLSQELHKISMDVEKKIEKVIKYNARNWNNQLVQKYLLSYNGDEKRRIIECMTIIHFQDETVRDLTIELSNMYNCVVGCRFCASGALPENTLYLKPIDYVRQLNTCLNESSLNPNEFECFFVSFAGIGEPSVVYKEIAAGMFMIKDLYPHVKFNIATFGYNMECFNYWGNLNLPIRTIQLPYYSYKKDVLKYIVQNLPEKYNFDSVLYEALKYKSIHTECRVKVNYIAMKGINDSEEDIHTMCNKLEKFKNEIVIRISFLNYTKPGGENAIIASGRDRLVEIEKYLTREGFDCYIFGTDINTELGCGQLTQSHISSC